MSSRLISTNAETLIPASNSRKSFMVQNEDGAINVFVKQESGESASVSTTDHDHRIAPGGSLAFNNTTDGEQAIVKRWTIIAASGTPRISVFETENISR